MHISIYNFSETLSRSFSSEPQNLKNKHTVLFLLLGKRCNLRCGAKVLKSSLSNLNAFSLVGKGRG